MCMYTRIFITGIENTLSRLENELTQGFGRAKIRRWYFYILLLYCKGPSIAEGKMREREENLTYPAETVTTDKEK